MIGISQPIVDKTDTPDPWEIHRLYLHVTIDRRAVSAQGIEQIRQEKLDETLKSLEKYESSDDPQKITVISEQNSTANKQLPKKLLTMAHRLQQSSPQRPNHTVYEGQSHIAVGVSFSRHDPVGVNVVDAQQQVSLFSCRTEELLVAYRVWIRKVNRGQTSLFRFKSVVSLEHQYRWVKCAPLVYGLPVWLLLNLEVAQILNDARLVQHLHDQHKARTLRRSREQRKGIYRENSSESNTNEYVTRVIAAAIVELAKFYRAGRIVIPNLSNIREKIEADIRTEAERRFPGNKTAQDEYAKDYRASFHRWHYHMLSQFIQERAARDGIAVQITFQFSQGALEEKAYQMAMAVLLTTTSC